MFLIALKAIALLLIALILLSGSVGLISYFPTAHADPACPFATPCISIVPSIETVSLGSTVILKVNFTNLITFSAWDIAVKTNKAVLNPTKITVVETFGGTGSAFSNCINGGQTGANQGCSSIDGPGVAHSAFGSLGASDTGNGTLFTVTYAASSTPGMTTVAYNNTVGEPSTISDPSGASLVDCSVTPSDCLTGSVTVAATSFSVSVNPTTVGPLAPSAVGNSTITVQGHNGFAGTVNLSPTAPSGVVATLNASSVTLSPSATTAFAKVSISSATPGIYHVNVTASSTGFTPQIVTVNAQVVDFSLSASPNPLGPLAVATNGTSTLTVSPVNGFVGMVNLALSAPAGVVASLASPSVTITSTSQTDVLTAKSAVPGIYHLNVTGSATGYPSHVVTVNVIVGLNYTLSANPSTVGPLAPGQVSNSNITITGTSGFSGTVQLTVSPTPPPSVAFSLNVSSVSITPTSPTAGAKLTVSGSTGGTFTLNVVGSSAGFPNRTAVVTLKIAGFAISANPTTVGPIAPSAFGTSTITITGQNGFSGTVLLSSGSTPTGFTAKLNVTSVVLSSTTTMAFAQLKVNGTVAGVYTVAVTGSSSPFPSHSATVTVDVADFSVTANPSTISSVPAGGVGSTTLTISGVGGFTGTVNLAASPSAGLSYTLKKPSVTITGTSGDQTDQLNVTAAAAGNYMITVTGSSPGFPDTMITVNVGVVDFTASASPTSVGPLAPSASGSSTLTIGPVNGFAGSVGLKATGSSGLTASLNVSSVSLAGSGARFAHLTVSGAAAGNYQVIVNATFGAGLFHLVTVNVVVVDFSVSPNPSTITSLASGVTGSSTLTISALNGFTGTVTLSVASTTGLSASLNASSVVLSSSVASRFVALSVNGTLGGTFTVTITGSISGFPSHAKMVSVTVTSPSITAGIPTASATSVKIGDKVVVNVTLTNNSPSTPTVLVLLKWGDITVASKNVTLLPNQATPVSLTFDTSNYAAGTSSLSLVVPATGTVAPAPMLTLNSASQPFVSLSNPLFLGLIAAIVVVAGAVLVFVLRGRMKRPGAQPKSSTQ